MCFRMSSVLVFLLAAGVAFAQSPTSSPTDQHTMQELLDRIERLEKRVAELEEHQHKAVLSQAGSSGGQTAAPAATEQKAPPLNPSDHQHMISNGQVQDRAKAHYPNLQIRGFADMGIFRRQTKKDRSRTAASAWDNSCCTSRLLLRERSATLGKSALRLNRRPTTLAVERSIIRYDYNDYFKLSFGKYHTPIGYWNTAFHHGAWLQTTISRPEMVKFGGSLIPIHFVGAQAEGNLPSGGLGLGYNLGLGNGRGSAFSKAGDSGDVNNNRAWVANLFARPTRLYGLQVGGSFYRDKLSTIPGARFDEWIAAGDVVWTKEHPEILAEYANVHHRRPRNLADLQYHVLLCPTGIPAALGGG